MPGVIYDAHELDELVDLQGLDEGLCRLGGGRDIRARDEEDQLGVRESRRDLWNDRLRPGIGIDQDDIAGDQLVVMGDGLDVMSLRGERPGDRRDIATAIQYGDLHGPRKRRRSARRRRCAREPWKC